MAVVEEYWSGVLRRLQAEVNIFNDLITHQGEKGRANELSLSQVIARLIPQRYAVGSGILIDSYDASSSQTDIVIFNQADEPAILAQSTQVLFPVENVALCIEVKTTVGKEEIEDAQQKHESVLALRPTTGWHPAYALVGFEGESSVDTLAGHIRNGNSTLDLVCVLREGLIAGHSRLLGDVKDATSDDYRLGLTCLEPNLQSSLLSEAQATQKGNFVNFVQHEGGLFPVIRRQNRQKLVSDPARALLLFCDGLLRVLAARDEVRAPVMSHYITAEARSLLELD